MNARRSPIGTIQPNDTSDSTGGRTCPRCKGSVYRIPRRLIDLLLSTVVPTHRYRCDTMGCNWEGNLRVARDFRKSRGREKSQARGYR
ncbi:MAG TPA: hypothetical protein VJ673_19715 [Aromatoleum sp.]|uniref:hypothetical protein n=1 Tax=Aromatoleum sp. TaxID=2307007 RepID=UPI002B48E13B|nr:hypothetical protein [Aromatoleum sp.]HJV27919.1 hypothetical protein [Aromatoleum sp.]